MKNRQKKILLVMVISVLSLGGCDQKKEPKTAGGEEVKNKETESASIADKEAEAELWEKGYNLPVEPIEQAEAEGQCMEAMGAIQELYKVIDKGSSLNAVIPDGAAEQMIEALKVLGCPVYGSGCYLSMHNYEKMEEFLSQSKNGEKSEIITYELHSGGEIGRKKFIFDGTDMYILSTGALWNDKEEPAIGTTDYTRIKNWEYTPKGWFHYELCVPEPPEVNEVIDGNVMLRVQPLKKEYRDITRRYLEPIGYQGNNLFCINWDIDHMERLDYNGLFEYLYMIKFQRKCDAKNYSTGIPGDEFESLLGEYLPISPETLRQQAAYDTDSESYEWANLGCGSYNPKGFGSSVPEAMDISENEDGTVTVTVDVVCEMLGNDAVLTHEVTMRFTEEGGVQFLGNYILGEGLKRIPNYQSRVGSDS